MTIEKVLEVIEKVYGTYYSLVLDVGGICGIESLSGVVMIDFKNLPELYAWAERQEV